MDEKPTDYLFDSREQCCKTWFAFESCPDPTAVTEPMFYPEWSDNVCGQKTNFTPWELDSFEVYETLDECCMSKFDWNLAECCSVEGLGGCEDARDIGVVKYLPDWASNKCDAGSTESLKSHEAKYASTSVRSCCNKWFGWDADGCRKRSGS